MAQLADPVDEAVATTHLGHPLGRTGQLVQDRQVLAQGLRDVRSLHLHHHRTAIAQRRGMHLRHRAGRQRFVIEAAEQGGDARVQFFLDHRAHGRDRHRRHIVLHALQRTHVGRRHHVRAGRQRLADLDEGGAERFQIVDELFGLARGNLVGLVRQGAFLHIKIKPVEQSGLAIAQQERADLRVAGKAAVVTHAWDPHPVESGTLDDPDGCCGNAASRPGS